MCILCVVQRWSRRVATMLPWLVLPLIFLWAFSQLLPPGFRFEVTSPRLACVLVLLLTLFWYEILLPQLSIWRARRSARLRERRRTQALELQKLRKTATRRCRNCLTPYRDQNPGAGRFMCSYCGHISKRPVLDLPGPGGSSRLISDLVAKNGWMCNQDWQTEGNGNWPCSVPRYWLDDRCLTEKSYSGMVASACKLISCFFSCVRWLCRKVFRLSSSREDSSSDVDHKGLKGGDNGGNLQGSKGEKARRKAEEKRQARLEKEMLEEEERKQREEVARLVEERRRLREEKLEAEERSKGATPVGERENKKEAEKRRQDRRKEKDKGSSKSNSDVEDLERRTIRETEKKRDFDKKSENERRDLQKNTSDNYKLHTLEANHGNKVTPSKPKYFGRMTGNFLSSSRGFTGASFFGRSAQGSAASFSKAGKPTIGFADHSHAVKRDAQSAAHTMAKATSNGDDRISGANCNRPASLDGQAQSTAPKKSWHQLFTRSATVSPYPDTNESSYQTQNGHTEAPAGHLSRPSYPLDNQINFGQSLPFPVYSTASGSSSSTSLSHFTPGPMFPSLKDAAPTSISEEPEHFEDPCYDPDAIALLGPVSESLDFHLDLGAGFGSSDKTEGPRLLKSVAALGEVTKPSPIESPLSRSRVSEQKHITSGQLSLADDASSLHELGKEQGTWQMWGSPLAQDGLGLVGGPSNWFLPIGQNKYDREDTFPLPHNHLVPQIANETHVLPSIQSQHAPEVNQQNGGTYTPFGSGLNSNDLWVQKTPFQPLPVNGDTHFLPLNLMENVACKDVMYGTPERSAATHSFELSPPANCWSKKEWASNDPHEAGSSNTTSPHVGGLFSTNPDVQSLWSFNEKETI
ncbi:uncharacterized protein [Typha angustifolia]|uniref:uncharacterized protein n=1 Tax=Typha angustifolia TaxID=59011 RepID=UPI003C3051FE